MFPAQIPIIMKKNELIYRNEKLNINFKASGSIREILTKMWNVIFCSDYNINDIEKGSIIFNGEKLPVYAGPFHYCFAKGRITEEEVINGIRFQAISCY